MKNFILPFFFVLITQAFFIFAGYEKTMGQDYRQKNFLNKADFFKERFVFATDFFLSRFHSEAIFELAQFDSIANFRIVQFYSTADFKNSLFNSKAVFFLTEFHSSADFKNAVFNSGSSFWGTIFHSEVYFTDTKFHSTADFTNSMFLSHGSFNATLLPDTVKFNHVIEINKEIDFTLAKLDSTKKAKNKNYKCQIALTGSDISKIKINYELFQLWFPEGTKYEEKISTYEKLLKKFQDDGFLESYKTLDIEYRGFKNRDNGDYALNNFMHYWWNYGYNKERVIYWALGFLGLFTLINIFLFDFLQRDVYEIKFKFYDKADFHRLYKPSHFDKVTHKSNLPSTPIGRRLFPLIRNIVSMLWHFIKGSASLLLHYFKLKFINSLMYTSIIFFGLRISLEHFKKFSGWTLYIWLIYVTGLFCLAYIFNIIIVK